MKTLEELQKEAEQEIAAITNSEESPSKDKIEESSDTPEDTNPKGEETTEKVSCDGLTRDELVTNYMFGIELKDQQGNPFPESLIIGYLNSAISYAEGLFDICLTKQTVTDESHDYERSDYMNWGYIQLYKRPIQKVTKLQLMYGTRPSFEVPLEWIKIDKMGGKIQMFPSSGNSNALIINQSGVIFGLNQAWSYAPQMWSVDYEAGMTKNDIPAELKELIYKQATCNIMTVWGDLILGAGIASQSISIDGLSQSIGTTQSAMYGGASARVESYRQDIDRLIGVLRMKLDVPRMTVL